MTAASWPKTLLIPPGAVSQWLALREALLAVRGTPCASDPDLWHSRNPSDIAAACDACHRCPALQQCDAYASVASESLGVWAGVDRNRRQRDATAEPPTTTTQPKEQR